MRPRWTSILFLSAGTVICGYAVCRGQGGVVDTLVGMARCLSSGAVFAVGFWAASLLLQKWMGSAEPTLPPMPPIPTLTGADALLNDAPVNARYRVNGFDQDSRFATTEFIYANSPSNAQLKVELKGVEVARVQKA